MAKLEGVTIVMRGDLASPTAQGAPGGGNAGRRDSAVDGGVPQEREGAPTFAQDDANEHPPTG